RGRGSRSVVDAAVPRGGVRVPSPAGLTTQAGFIRVAQLKCPKSGKPDFGWSIFFANKARFSKAMDCRDISAFTRVFRRAMPGNDGTRGPARQGGRRRRWLIGF